MSYTYPEAKAPISIYKNEYQCIDKSKFQQGYKNGIFTSSYNISEHKNDIFYVNFYTGTLKYYITI